MVLKASYSIFKDEQLKKIYKKNQDHESCVVLRGNTARTLKIWDLVVGDVVKLTQGDKVPMDSLVLSSNGLLVDQSKCLGEDQRKEKYESPTNFPVEKNKDRDPFLFADSYVNQGNCTALICSVGEYSSRPQLFDLNVRIESKEAQDKIRNLVQTLTFFGIGSMVIILVSAILIQAV